MTHRIYHYPSEAEGDTDQAPEAPGDADAVLSDSAARLEADLKAAKAEAADWQDRFLRKAAELENYRKRADRERGEAIAHAKGSVLLEFLPVADACERALRSVAELKGAAGDFEQFREGVELLYKQLMETLGRVGVVAMEAEGKRFDPHMHEAFSREETEDHEENTVLRELRRGYLFKDKLLRPAQVVVAVSPSADDKAS